MEQELEYPGICAKCGNRWGDHMTDLWVKQNGGCPFVAKEGEIQKPTLKNKED